MRKGSKMTPEAIEKIRLAKTGAKYPNRKRPTIGLTPIHKQCESCKKDFVTNCLMPKKRFCSRKCSYTVKNPRFTTLGRKGSEKQREMMRNKRGELHPRWVKDRSKKLDYQQHKSSDEWKNWRKSVFERDEYTCQDCGVNGVYIEPHHIIPLRITWKKMYDISNGITLCRKCHQKTFYKEEEFAERYIKKLTEL